MEMAAARRASRAPAETASESAMRDQEVVRANRELAAYFKGQRTEREARAALKIIKAFVRDRERADARNRRPLPGLRAARPSAGGDEKTARAKPRKPGKARKRRAARPPAPERVVAPDEAASAALSDD
jgi:hypothetical protein